MSTAVGRSSNTAEDQTTIQRVEELREELRDVSERTQTLEKELVHWRGLYNESQASLEGRVFEERKERERCFEELEEAKKEGQKKTEEIQRLQELLAATGEEVRVLRSRVVPAEQARRESDERYQTVLARCDLLIPQINQQQQVILGLQREIRTLREQSSPERWSAVDSLAKAAANAIIRPGTLFFPWLRKYMYL